MARPLALAVRDIPAPPDSIIQAADKTVREVLPPWHLLQKKMEEKEKEKLRAAMETPPPPAPEALMALEAFEDTPVPSSGVRLSDAPIPAANASGSDDGLSYKVYTIADLERRSDAPVAMAARMSRGSFDQSASRSAQHALRARNAVLGFFKAALAWARTSKTEREPIKKALRAPFDQMGDELEFVVRSIDWKKAGVYTGIAVGATLTLLFAVLTAAELTDDLHPANGAARTSMTSAPPPAAAPALPTTATVAVAPVAAPAPAPEEIVEIDSPAPAPAKKPVAKKGVAPGGKKKLAFRNADDVFKP